MKKYLFSQKDLLGYIACWSVMLSPYNVPENLTGVLETFALKTKPLFEGLKFEIMSASSEEICLILDKHLITQVSVIKWNERKDGNTEPYLFVSKYESKPNPDNDFIDLGALKRNIVNSIIYDNERNEAFEIKHKASINGAADNL
jgi:hypothetical protein